jgi:formate/nitrite transporter FocA (FNT family)
VDTQAKLPLSPREARAADARAAPTVNVVYETVRREGQSELERSTAALAWSGLAAGLSMGSSLFAQGLLHSHLPPAPWRDVVAKLGYSMGFVVVILARQQLFTENTLTPMLPLFVNRDRATTYHVVRLWATVLAANLTGALLFAIALAHGHIVDDSVRAACIEVARAAASGTAKVYLVRGVMSGWLIALMVWMLPAAHYSRVTIIVAVTYLVALGDLSHVVAGAVDVFFLAATGVRSFGDALGYIGPTLVGNMLGGIALTAALNHAQTVSA